MKEMKAKIAKLEAKVVDDKATGGDKKESVIDKKASDDKIGKCPVCDTFHYYESRRGSTKGQNLTSAFLSACPKYVVANVDARSTMIVDNKACAVCTDWRHERPACLFKKPKPCRETDCCTNHHSTMHGSTNPKVMAIKMTSTQDDLNQYGLLPMAHYVFKEVNQGTTVFMDKGSNTSLIRTKLANALFLKGKIKLTIVIKAFDGTTQA